MIQLIIILRVFSSFLWIVAQASLPSFVIDLIRSWTLLNLSSCFSNHIYLNFSVKISQFLGRQHVKVRVSWTQKITFKRIVKIWTFWTELKSELTEKCKTQLTCGMFWNNILTQRNNVNSRNLSRQICNCDRTRSSNRVQQSPFWSVSNYRLVHLIFLTTQRRNHNYLSYHNSSWLLLLAAYAQRCLGAVV